MRKFWIFGILLLACVILAAGALLLLVDPNRFRAPLQSEMEKRIGGRVELGPMSLKLFPPVIRIQDVVIHESPAFNPGAPFVSAKELYVRASLPALIGGQIEIQSLRALQPAVELIRNASGQWNFSSLVGGGAGSTPAFASLAIEDGRVAVTDRKSSNARSVYEHINLGLRDSGDGGSLTVAAARLKQPLRVDYRLGHNSRSGVLDISSFTVKLGDATASGHAAVETAAHPMTINGAVRVDRAAIADVLRLADAFGIAPGVSGSGTFSLTLEMHGLAEEPALSGSAEIRDVSLNLPALTKPIAIQSTGAVFAGDRINFQNVSAAIGGSHAHGSLAVTHFKQPHLEFTAEIDRLDSTEMERWMAPRGRTERPESRSSLSGKGTIHAGSFTINQLALTDVRATCQFDDASIRLEPMSARLYGGEETGSLTVDLRRDQTSYAIRSKLQHVDANALLSAVSSVRQTFFGTLSGALDLAVSPAEGQEIARAVNGTAQIQVTGGRLAGVHLLNEAAALGRLAGYTKRSEPFTAISRLSGSMRIQNGVAATNDLQADFDGGSLTAAGTIGLADQALNLRVTTILGREFTPASGSGQIGGWLTTALANQKGELVIPSIVTGTFSKPRFEPDPARMAKMKLDGLLPTRGNPAAFGSRIQDLIGGFNGKRNPAPAQGQKTPGLQDLLDTLRKPKDSRPRP